jgi:SAM-dependent methyltransferase
MTIGYSYTRYLSSKTSVDDRALNQHVVAELRGQLSLHIGPLRILELGAGVGTMVARLIEWGVLKIANYALLDVDERSLKDAREWLTAWAQRGGYALTSEGDALVISRANDDICVRVELVAAELRQHLAERSQSRDVHLLIANAFLDLIDVPTMMPSLFELIVPAGLYWFSINFDGHTIFEPGHPNDDRFLAVYHHSMDVRIRYGRPAGDSKSGRHLFSTLSALGARVLAAGSSDWVVHGNNGSYHADEAYFLHHIIHTVDEELRRWPDIDELDLAKWIALRHSQIDRGELVYIAHQLDFVGRRP